MFSQKAVGVLHTWCTVSLSYRLQKRERTLKEEGNHVLLKGIWNAKGKGQASQPWQLVFAAKSSPMTSVAAQCTTRWAEMLKRVPKPFREPKYNANNRKVRRDYVSVKSFSISKRDFQFPPELRWWLKSDWPGITFDVEFRLFYWLIDWFIFLSCIFKNTMLGWMYFSIFSVELKVQSVIIPSISFKVTQFFCSKLTTLKWVDSSILKF